MKADGEPALELGDLIQEAWQIYVALEDQPCLVKPSIPVLFFGNADAYSRSELKVITVGLNPSKDEFPEGNAFLRFSKARCIYPRILDGFFCEEYLQALNEYFRRPPNDPYRWFDCFEHLLLGLGTSYYGNAPNVALHTDLCSPLATRPTWSKLAPDIQSRFLRDGPCLWHRLVERLSPDVIIASLRRSHLARISFSLLEGWSVAYTVERKTPYIVETTKLRLQSGKVTSLVFGRAAQTPFGNVSYADRRKIGAALRCLFAA